MSKYQPLPQDPGNPTPGKATIGDEETVGLLGNDQGASRNDESNNQGDPAGNVASIADPTSFKVSDASHHHANIPELHKVSSLTGRKPDGSPAGAAQENVLHDYCVQELSSQDFDLHKFITSLRAKAPLPTLREELRKVQNEFNQELVSRIQHDFNAFVALGTSLQDAESLSLSAKGPLSTFREDLVVLQSDTQHDIEMLELSLSKRRVLSQRRRQLELLLRVSELVHKCERLLKEVKARETKQAERDKMADGTGLHKLVYEEDEEYWRMIERIAGEYSQLSFSCTRSEAQGNFLASLRDRIETVKSDIVIRLEHLFKAGLSAHEEAMHSSTARPTRGSHLSSLNPKLVAHMKRILNAYGMASLVEEAEHVFRTQVVSPFVVENLRMVKAFARAELMHKADPKTMASAMALKKPITTSTASDAMIATEAAIKDFMEENCGYLIELCSARAYAGSGDSSLAYFGSNLSRSETAGTAASRDQENLAKFDFVTRCIWPEIVKGMTSNMMPVFSPGIPDVFHASFKSAVRVFKIMEAGCPRESQLQALRSCGPTSDFWKRWNLAVYFQLRLQQITSDFIDALERDTSKEKQQATGPDAIAKAGSDGAGASAAGEWNASENAANPTAGANAASPVNTMPNTLSITSVQAASGRKGFRLLRSDIYQVPATQALIEALRLCWDENIFLAPLANRFLRLSLQCISRYITWCKAGMESAWRDTEDMFLETASKVYADIETMKSRLPAEIASLLRVQVGSELPGATLAIVDSAFANSTNSLDSLLPPLADAISTSIGNTCCEGLQPLRGILATYRMTNKPPPTQHSRFVTNILKPYKAFVTSHGQHLSQEATHLLTMKVSECVSQKYFAMAKDLLDSVKKAEDVLKRLSLGKGVDAKQGGSSSDTDKISLQLFLDVRKFGSEIEHFDVKLAEIPAYSKLWLFIKEEAESRMGAPTRPAQDVASTSVSAETALN